MVDTYTDNLAGEEITFLFGDGGGPETFTASCTINTNRKIDLTSELTKRTSKNCTDPSKPAKVFSAVKSIEPKFSGAGFADANSYKALVLKWKAGVAFNGIASVTRAGATLAITGAWVVESISLGGDAAEDAVFDISLAVGGDWELT